MYIKQFLFHPKGWNLPCLVYVKKGFKFTEYTTYEVLRSWAKQNLNHPLVNGMKPTEWATQFILAPQELEEYKKTHSVK